MDVSALLTPGAAASVIGAVGWFGKRVDSAFVAQSAKVDALVERLITHAHASVTSSEARTEKVVAALTEVGSLVRDTRDVMHRVVAALDRVERLLDDHDDRPSARGSRVS